MFLLSSHTREIGRIPNNKKIAKIISGNEANFIGQMFKKNRHWVSKLTSLRPKYKALWKAIGIHLDQARLLVDIIQYWLDRDQLRHFYQRHAIALRV